ncbi:hypothetical protein LCGC14_1916840, partial [marine sediment metagenome]
IEQLETPGERRWDDIYDGTAQMALDIHVNGIFGNFTNPTFPWFRLAMRNQVLNDLRAVRVYLQEVEEQLYGTMSASNYYDEKFLQIQDGATIGTAPLYIEEDFERGGIVAMAIHPAESYLSHNDKNVIDVFHRTPIFTLKQIIAKFGVDNIPGDLVKMAESNPFLERKVIHAVYKREDYDPFKLDVTNKEFGSVWVLTAQTSSTGTQDKSFEGELGADGQKTSDILLREGGFDTMPYHVWRPYRDTREEYGRSPAMRALPDAMGLNIIGKTLLGVAERAAEPPANVPTELEGMADFGARGINYVSNTDNGIQFIESGREYPIARDRELAKQESVRQAFNVDFFIALSTSGAQTATEALLIEGEKAVILMSSVTRLQGVTSDDLERIVQIESAAGRLPEPPDVLRESNEEIDIAFLGPLQQVQSRLFQTRGISQTMADVTPAVQLFGPEVLRNFDGDIVVREIAEGNVFPAKAIRPLKEVQEERQQAQALAEQQAQEEAMALKADTAAKLAKADKDSEGQLTEALAASEEG